ncbi:MAG: DNA polymerase IV [Erysipelotrichaceae bacterium]|nr:DNA polymerase IV [Erysipelotrichaceae bacterium]
MARVLFHIDLNAFFASAEELRHPEYKDEPLAVGSASARGVVATANYKAREYGIHSAMPVMQAFALCENLIVVPGDHDYYRKLSNQFFDYLRTWSGALEILSIDECFLDVTDVIRHYKRPLDLAVQIQQGVLHKLGLKCSIGVAPTRFLAKMASDMHKPLGITVLRKSEIPAKLYPLPVEEMIGIGKKTVPLLKKENIEKIGDLMLEENQPALKRILKSSYYDLQKKLKGLSSDQLVFSTTRKSVSHSRTFQQDLYSEQELVQAMEQLCREVCQAMNRAGRKGRMVSLILRDSSFRNKVRSVSLQNFTNDYAMIRQAAFNLLLENMEEGTGYRLLGISIGSLQDEKKVILQPTLFDKVQQDPTRQVLDTLNKSLQTEEGHPLLMKASDLLKEG